MANSTVISIIETHRIRNAHQLTEFLMGDENKGIITPYPEGYGASLWMPRLKALKDFYGVNTRKKERIQTDWNLSAAKQHTDYKN